MMPLVKERNMRSELLDAAIRLFSEYGFDRTSVRDIVKCADATLSSVSYYFGGKEELYLEASRYILTEKLDINNLFGDIDPEQHDKTKMSPLFHRNIKRVLYAFLADVQSSMYGKFLCRMMIESRQEIVAMFSEYFSIVDRRLYHIMKYVNPSLDDDDIQILQDNMWGQINIYVLARDVILNKQSASKYSKSKLDKVALHITNNLLRALHLPLISNCRQEVL